MMISGVINWEKIENHKKEYLSSGNPDWNMEFRRFTSRAENFKDRVLVLSGGPYSNYPAEKAGYTEKEWKQISVDIRMYHECTHYVCRRRWQEKQNAVMDEVVADAIGLLGAVGHFDKKLAMEFLGITEEGKYVGGRLKVYVKEEELDEAAELALKWINKVEAVCQQNPGGSPF